MKAKLSARHATNVTNFALLIDSCELMGPAVYKPMRPDLAIDKMRASCQRAQAALDECQHTRTSLTQAILARDEAFADFGKKITRIYNALQASSTSMLLDERVRMIIRRLRGSTPAPEPTPDPEGNTTPTEPTVHHSLSRTSTGALMETGHELLTLLQSTSEYQTDEADLKIEALSAWLTDLQTKSQAVLLAHLVHNRSRDARNLVLYGPKEGIVDIAADCKAYLRSALGTQHPEYRRIASLTIQNLG